MIVARIGIPALTIIQLVTNRVVIVALNTLDVVMGQQRKNSIWMRSECAHVTQAVDMINALSTNISKCGFQSQIIAVQTAQAGDFLKCTEFADDSTLPFFRCLRRFAFRLVDTATRI